MFLAANVFGEILLEPNGHPEVQQIAHETLIAARSVVRTVIQSDIYTASVKYCGFLFKVCGQFNRPSHISADPLLRTGRSELRRSPHP